MKSFQRIGLYVTTLALYFTSTLYQRHEEDIKVKRTNQQEPIQKKQYLTKHFDRPKSEVNL